MFGFLSEQYHQLKQFYSAKSTRKARLRIVDSSYNVTDQYKKIYHKCYGHGFEEKNNVLRCSLLVLSYSRMSFLHDFGSWCIFTVKFNRKKRRITKTS